MGLFLLLLCMLVPGKLIVTINALKYYLNSETKITCQHSIFWAFTTIRSSAFFNITAKHMKVNG